MYAECFTGIGEFKDFEYHINVDKNVKLVVHAPQKIALSLQGKLEKELEEMVRQVPPVEGHPDWVNSLVIREKPNGSLRICLDPKDLNKAINPIPKRTSNLSSPSSPSLMLYSVVTRLNIKHNNSMMKSC